MSFDQIIGVIVLSIMIIWVTRMLRLRAIHRVLPSPKSRKDNPFVLLPLAHHRRRPIPRRSPNGNQRTHRPPSRMFRHDGPSPPNRRQPHRHHHRPRMVRYVRIDETTPTPNNPTRQRPVKLTLDFPSPTCYNQGIIRDHHMPRPTSTYRFAFAAINGVPSAKPLHPQSATRGPPGLNTTPPAPPSTTQAKRNENDLSPPTRSPHHPLATMDLAHPRRQFLSHPSRGAILRRSQMTDPNNPANLSRESRRILNDNPFRSHL